MFSDKYSCRRAALIVNFIIYIVDTVSSVKSRKIINLLKRKC